MSYFCDKSVFILSAQLEIIFYLFVNTNICFFMRFKTFIAEN